jgi:predicted helicase
MSPRGMVKKSSHIEWINLSHLFPVSKVGVKTHDDDELISKTKFNTPFDQLYAYRPFDTRHINYDRTKVERDRYEVVQHFIGHRNLGIVIDRQVMADNWSHFQVVEHMIDNRLHYSRKGNPYLCPIYLFDKNGKKTLNLDMGLVQRFEVVTNLVFSSIETDDPKKFDVLDLVDYSYGILFCNIFRHKFAASLSLDFPSIPLPATRKAFRAFAEQGNKLRELHSYGTKVPNDLAIVFTEECDSVVRNCKWEGDRVYINPKCYLFPVSESIWNYCFCGYRGLQKWLKDRHGEALSRADINHMINVFNIIDKSIEISKFIDTLSLEYFNGFENDDVKVDLLYQMKKEKDVEYTITARQTEWRDAAHRPTSGFTAD